MKLENEAAYELAKSYVLTQNLSTHHVFFRTFMEVYEDYDKWLSTGDPKAAELKDKPGSQVIKTHPLNLMGR
ncbi:hypothetical protein [Sodalis sp. RH16]|uniref:hypothetical protein n=1 Tax=unclassified Sodalis (in: enterobacteria) TaxID=2636512 RepID=UPI0039B4A7F4